MVYCYQFRELLEYLENKFTIPGKLKLTNHSLKIEEEMMENIKNLLKETKKSISNNRFVVLQRIIKFIYCHNSSFFHIERSNL